MLCINNKANNSGGLGMLSRPHGQHYIIPDGFGFPLNRTASESVEVQGAGWWTLEAYSWLWCYCCWGSNGLNVLRFNEKSGPRLYFLHIYLFTLEVNKRSNDKTIKYIKGSWDSLKVILSRTPPIRVLSAGWNHRQFCTTQRFLAHHRGDVLKVYLDSILLSL